MTVFDFREHYYGEAQRTLIMGIVNITPDSFSDGGKYFDTDSAVEHALELIEDGADIIDLGACSTKPFSSAVTPDEEIKRLLPVLCELKKRTDTPLSVDTFNTETAAVALQNGAMIINDVSGVFCENTAMLIKEYGAGYIVMHGGVKVAPSETECNYPAGIVNHVQSFFDETVYLLEKLGLSKGQICLDPGFGFMKNTRQNAELLRNLGLLDNNGCTLLAGLSRKRFVGELSGDSDPSDRLAGTLAANLIAVKNGARIVRTHDVRMHKRAFALFDSVQNGF